MWSIAGALTIISVVVSPIGGRLFSVLTPSEINYRMEAPSAVEKLR